MDAQKTLVITSHVDGLDHVRINGSEYTSIIAADGGSRIAQLLSLTPTHTIGDYDSSTQPQVSAEHMYFGTSDTGAAAVDLTDVQTGAVIVLPHKKNMTDTEAALDVAWRAGAPQIDVLGGLGGRLDHTLGNLALLAHYADLDPHRSIRLIDGYNCVWMLTPGSHVIDRDPTFTYAGFMPYTPIVRGLTLRGVEYPLTMHDVTNDSTLTVSNEITAQRAQVSFSEGRLLVVLSRDANTPVTPV